jgi:hypothetical protein
MMKTIFTLLLAAALFIPGLAQDPEPSEANAAAAAAAAAAAEAEAPEAPEALEALEAPEAPEAPEISEDEAVDQAIDEAINESPKEKGGDTTSVIGRVEVVESPDKTRVTLGTNEVIIVEENGDSVIIGLGSKGISIVEDGDGVRIKVMDMDSKRSKSHKKKFNPHWAGISVGLNNYLTPDNSMVLPSDQYYMDLNTGKSWNWNINVIDFGVPLGTKYVGLVSGLGFEFINYNFNGQNSIMKDPVSGEIVEYIPPYAGFITKSKMNIAYMTIPLLLEFHIPAGRDKIYISTGVIGGLKLWSNAKIKYTESGDRSKEKNKSDFNLSPLRWGVTARVGYKWIGIYANYYMTSLFKPTMGPELYPFAVGIAFTW